MATPLPVVKPAPTERFSRICSDCGICTSSLRPHVKEACAFLVQKYDELEVAVQGHARRAATDELYFGPYEKIFRVRRRRPLAGAQWTGVVTTVAMRALERGLVEGVILTGTEPGTLNKPMPVLAQTPEEVFACRGNKFGLSPTLEKIDDAVAAGLKRVMVVGTPCQFHALRVIEPTLPFDELWCLGILCSDNTTHENYQKFLKSVSRSPETVVQMEFMPDFRLWMRHVNGDIEKLNFVEIPMHEIGPDLIAPSCRVCFNYTNSLADLSVGYMGGGMPDVQWLLVRNAKGWRLLDLIRDDVDLEEPTEGGSRALAMKGFMAQLGKPYTKGAPRPVKKLIAFMQRRLGPRGLEFARTRVEMKLAEGLFTVRQKASHRESLLVPRYAYAPLAKYVLPGETQPPTPPPAAGRVRPRKATEQRVRQTTTRPVSVG
ncbi:MAG: Coenzyme F420 hydrogenase/dehydrogenase, beta subunit C-terminal domain [Chloracidobacterium sp.]|nr:Coenzyme F420 hydrogenase/dehydrogenase, beta subunit C-terminal domain [Chloracidobacterium sp.]MDW8217714.1 Coenzyme F420 hydrogenase/dehydrogenase, beta subunit C-terminal domain [Acidobacteriota bacterium]